MERLIKNFRILEKHLFWCLARLDRSSRCSDDYIIQTHICIAYAFTPKFPPNNLVIW